MENIKTFFRMYGQLRQILDKKRRRTALILALLSIISAFVETLGIGVILPFILAILQPFKLLEYPTVKKVFDAMSVDTELEIVLVAGIGVVIVYVLKNTYILIFNRVKCTFRNNLECDLSIEMLRSYIGKPYSYFVNVNSAEIMRGVVGDNTAVASVVDCYANLLNEVLTCIMIGIVLIMLNPLMALVVVGMAGMIALGLVVFLRKKISNCGRVTREAFAERYKFCLEAVNGIKEIIVMKRQDNFLGRFAAASRKASASNTRYLWYSMLPSRLIETVFIICLVVMVVVTYFAVDNISVIVAQFSALAVASVRILPSISNISNAMNSLVYNRLGLESAYNNIIGTRKGYGINRDAVSISADKSDKENNAVPEDESSSVAGVESNVAGVDPSVDLREDVKAAGKDGFREGLRINEITFSYDNNTKKVIDGLSISIKPGESIGLVGESGAGKTTLADIILGLFVPQKGDITVDGRSIYDENVHWNRYIGYVPQNIYLMDDTLKNNILFGIDQDDYDEERLNQAIKEAQLESLVEQLPKGVETILGERGVKISGGQRQRIAIARALYYNPSILVLDEATSALDNETEKAVIESIEALHGTKTLIIVAHRLSTIENCDSVYEIRKGKAVKKEKNV
ncbi:MAG: ABC transporter ATP-binding protein/permease [Lachnospiraceae bacterium]|nr:ABC transporter ATP-binding protein/permease [Lachnospiraceae bacterium]